MPTSPSDSLADRVLRAIVLDVEAGIGAPPDQQTANSLTWRFDPFTLDVEVTCNGVRVYLNYPYSQGRAGLRADLDCDLSVEGIIEAVPKVIRRLLDQESAYHAERLAALARFR